MVSSFPLLGLEYFYEYLDRYPAKEHMLKTLRDCARSVPAATSPQLTLANSSQFRWPIFIAFSMPQDLTWRVTVLHSKGESYGRHDHEPLQDH